MSNSGLDKRPSEVDKRPSLVQLEIMLERRDAFAHIRFLVIGIVSAIIVFAAAAVLVSTIWFPVFRLHEDSMSPTMLDGEIILFIKSDDISKGDIIGFQFASRVYIKRVVAVGGESINIDRAGRVYIDGALQEEPYIEEFSRGEYNIEFPYEVPEGHFFVLGDHRKTSLDSRSTTIGTVAPDQIAGKALIRIWPLTKIGSVY